MNVAICDDEEYVRVYIRRMIERQKVTCKITEFSSGRELLEFQKEQGEEAIDLLFLDISMKDISGMDAAQQLRDQRKQKGKAVWGSLPLLIFVTGHSEYIGEAFSVNAFQFLIKPVKEQEFEKVFVQAVEEYHRLITGKPREKRGLIVRNRTVTRNISADDIYYVESSNRKVILCLEQEKIAYYDRISQLEQELGKNFFRVHKGYLIHMKYVERYSRTEVRMANGDNVLISKYKYQDFVKAYLEYMSEEK